MIEIVPMRLRHIPEVARLEETCFSSPWSAATLRDGLGNPQWVFYVALRTPPESPGKEQVAGYGGMLCAAGDCYIANIAVFPECRRQGAATALLLRLIDKARELGGEFVSLEVRESNVGAMALYEKLGFRRAGLRKNYYEKPRENALIYTLWF